MLSLLAFASATASLGDVPSRLLDHLTTGVNVTRWFCYLESGDRTAHYRDYLTDKDFQAFQKLGVRFVRLCITPDVVYRNGDLDPSVVPYIDAAIDRFERHGIDVIWDLHDNGQLHLDTPGADDSGFVSFWTAVARHYSGRHRGNLIFELLNEPQFQRNPDTWYSLQEQTVRAIREVDPARTIMVTSTSWSGIDTFAKMKPLPERNVVYTFHCYDPFFFTHQGAEWVGEYPRDMHDVPFPSSREAIEAILPENQPKFRDALIQYGEDHYDDNYLRNRLGEAVDWGLNHQLPVVLGEFGAYPKVSPPASRARWFEGMRAAIRSYHLANALWGYDDGLGLGRRVQSDGTLYLDPVTLRSLYHVSP